MYWTDVTDIRSPGTYRFYDNGYPYLTYTNWGDQRPAGGAIIYKSNESVFVNHCILIVFIVVLVLLCSYMYTIHVLNPWLCSTGGVSRCVAMNSGSRAGLWYDIMCNMTSGAVCEKLRLGYTSPATPPPTTPGLPCPANWIEVNNYCYQVGKFEPSPVC